MTDSVKSSTPEWVHAPPSLFDIVTGYYPESKPDKAGPKLRPCLVTRVLRNKKSGEVACEIAYGTRNLKTWKRIDKDVIVQNISDLDEIGLPQATRFNLDDDLRIIMPWRPPYFDCWAGFRTPRIGALTEDYQKDYAYMMMKRMSE